MTKRPTEPQAFESTRKSARNRLTNTVPRQKPRRAAREHGAVYAASGARKYLNAEERRRILAAVQALAPERAVFIKLLLWSGARVSELLALNADAFQIESSIVAIVTLKRRKTSIREIPIPPGLMAEIDRVCRLSALQAEGCAAPVFGWSRATAWRMVGRVCRDFGIAGPRACPRGLRHGYGVGTLQSGVPLNLIQRWMGHARMETTAIYAGVSGPDEMHFARGFWRMAAASGARLPSLMPSKAHAAPPA